MSGRRPLFAWDTCIFIAWLKNEQGHEVGTLDGIEHMVEQCDRGEITIVTSAITIVEVLQTHLDSATADRFSKVLKRPSVHVAACDQRIATLARDVREDLHRRDLMISTPDAIHLATAIQLGALEFHTLDGKLNRKVRLLGINGDIAGHQITIRQPCAEQPRFPDMGPTKPKKR